MLALGELVADRYRIDELLGEGGFGSVYAATDTHGDRRVALKCFKPDTAAGYVPGTRARFRREVQMVARLRSPHTVRLFDHGESAGGVLYMVFEHIEGEDLHARLRRVGRFDVASALHVLEQLLDAVGEAHAEGLLHRDIKSPNVRISAYMDDPLFAKLLDFGLARGTDGGHPGVTATGEFVGTPRYMAPEQLLEEELTPATDIYCLGLVAYEMLFGLDVLSSNSVHHQIDRLKTGHLIAPRAREGLPPQLVAVLEKMTARAPADRYQSVREVVKALAAPSTEDAPTNRLPQVPRPPDDDGRRRPLAIFAVLSVAVILAAVAVWMWPRPPEEAALAPMRRDLSTLVASADVASTPSSPVSRTDVGTAEACVRSEELVGSSYLEANIITGDRWLTYVPPSVEPTTPAPLVILLHQKGHTAETLLEYGGFKPLADEHRFMLIAPHDSDYDPWDPSEDHVVGIMTMLDHATEAMCVDERRVFLVGHGNGGALADHLACMGWARALATHALPRSRDDIFCRPIRPTPFAHFYPTKSDYEPYAGGTSRTGKDRESVWQIEQRWIARNGCDTTPREHQVHGSQCFTFQCETPFISCHVEGGHGWPGTPRRSRYYAKLDGDGPEPDADFPMAKLIWEFFAALEPIAPVKP